MHCMPTSLQWITPHSKVAGSLMPFTPHSRVIYVHTLARGKILLGAPACRCRIPSVAVSILEVNIRTEAWLQAALCC